MANSSSAASTDMVEHVGDRLAVELDGQGLGGVAGAAAGVAGDPDIGQEVHLDPLLAGPLAGLAPAAGLVEAEPPGRVAADLGLGELGEQLADQVEDPRVGRRGRVGSAPQRRLVDADHLVDLFQALDRLVGAGSQLGAVQGPRGGFPQDVFHQRALARARDARHGRDDAQREPDVEVPEVVLPRPLDHDRRARPNPRRPGRRLVGTGIAALPLR